MQVRSSYPATWSHGRFIAGAMDNPRRPRLSSAKGQVHPTNGSPDVRGAGAGHTSECVSRSCASSVADLSKMEGWPNAAPGNWGDGKNAIKVGSNYGGCSSRNAAAPAHAASKLARHVSTNASNARRRAMQRHDLDSAVNWGGARRRIASAEDSMNASRAALRQQSSEVDVFGALFDEEESVVRSGMAAFLIFPDSAFKFAWERMLLAFLVCVYIWHPLELAGMPPTKSPFTMTVAFDLVRTVVYCADVLVVSLSVVEEFGMRVVDPRTVLQRYAARGMAADVAACLPFETIALAFGGGHGWSILALAAKLPRFGHLGSEVRTSFVKRADMRVLAVLVQWTIFAHWFACFWFWVGTVGIPEEDEQSWVKAADLEGAAVHTKYIRSLYYTVATMTSLGFAHVVPGTDLEHLITVVMQLFGNLMTASLLGSVIAYVKKLDEAADQLQSRVQNLRHFSRVHAVSGKLQQTLYDYTIALMRSGFATHGALDETLLFMPPGIRTDVLLQMRRHLVENVPMFRDRTEAFVREVVLSLKPILCLAGNRIYKALESAEEMYFIERGSVVLMTRSERRAYVKLDSGSFFGELAMVSTCARTNTAKALADSHLFSLSADKFSHVMRKYPADISSVLEGAKLELANILSSDLERDPRVRREVRKAFGSMEAAAQEIALLSHQNAGDRPASRGQDKGVRAARDSKASSRPMTPEHGHLHGAQGPKPQDSEGEEEKWSDDDDSLRKQRIVPGSPEGVAEGSSRSDVDTLDSGGEEDDNLSPTLHLRPFAQEAAAQAQLLTGMLEGDADTPPAPGADTAPSPLSGIIEDDDEERGGGEVTGADLARARVHSMEGQPGRTAGAMARASASHRRIRATMTAGDRSGPGGGGMLAGRHGSFAYLVTPSGEEVEMLVPRLSARVAGAPPPGPSPAGGQ